MSMLHYFFDTTIFTVYVIACRGPNIKVFHFWKTVMIKDHRYIPIHVYTQCS